MHVFYRATFALRASFEFETRPRVRCHACVGLLTCCCHACVGLLTCAFHAFVRNVNFVRICMYEHHIHVLLTPQTFTHESYAYDSMDSHQPKSTPNQKTWPHTRTNLVDSVEPECLHLCPFRNSPHFLHFCGALLARFLVCGAASPGSWSLELELSLRAA